MKRRSSFLTPFAALFGFSQSAPAAPKKPEPVNLTWTTKRKWHTAVIVDYPNPSHPLAPLHNPNAQIDDFAEINGEVWKCVDRMPFSKVVWFDTPSA